MVNLACWPGWLFYIFQTLKSENAFHHPQKYKKIKMNVINRNLRDQFSSIIETFVGLVILIIISVLKLHMQIQDFEDL